MPLMRNFPFHDLRIRSTKAQSIAGFCIVTPVMSMPSYIGRSWSAGPGCAFVAGRALLHVLRARAQKRFAVAPGRVIHGQGDHRAPRSFDAVQDLLAGLPRTRRVELLPHRPAQRLVDFFDGRRCRRGQELQSAARFGRPRHGQFAAHTERFLAAGRAQEDRAAVRGAEQLDAHVHFRSVAQPPRTQLNVLEPFAIGAQRAVVVHAAGHVSPVARDSPCDARPPRNRKR